MVLEAPVLQRIGGQPEIRRAGADLGDRLAELAAEGAAPALRASRPFYSEPEAARRTTEESAILGTPRECIERLRLLEAAGVRRVLFSNPRPEDLRLFAREVMPAFSEAPAPA